MRLRSAAIAACALAAAAPQPAATLEYDPHATVRATAAARASAAAGRQFVIGGARWPGRVIRIFDGSPASYRTGVRTAIREWNARGLRIRFALVGSARGAQVVVRESRRIAPGGRATLGYSTFGRAAVELNMRRAEWYDVAWVTSHELGHILGLDHSSGCNVMSYSAYTACRPSFSGELWEWRCRLQERGDLLGVQRLYGGAFRLRPAAHCLKSPAAARVAPAVVPGDRTRVATVTWAKARRAAAYRIARSGPGGACPTDMDQAQELRATAFVDELQPWQERVGARYCYSVWSLNRDGAPTGPATVRVDYVPPLPAPVSGLTATVTVDAVAEVTGVALTWQEPPGTTMVRVLRSDPNGACRLDAREWQAALDVGRGTALDYGSPGGLEPGTYCYSAFATDDPAGEEWSAPVTASVVVPQPATAS